MSKFWRLKALVLVGLLAVACMGSDGIGGIVHRQSPENVPAAAATIAEASCNARDPLSPCFYEPPHGIPVGELLIVEHFF
jgi:hypothetical protein